LLDALKRRGRAGVPELAEELGLNVETIRSHLKALVASGLVERVGALRYGPGRPEIIYALTDAAEMLFPRREGEILRGLGTYLVEQGHEQVLQDFFADYARQRSAEAAARIARIEKRGRLDEVVRVLSEWGFMPVVEESGRTTRLRLCHCPLRDLIDATRVPCRAEIDHLMELLGKDFERVGLAPDCASCARDLVAT